MAKSRPSRLADAATPEASPRDAGEYVASPAAIELPEPTTDRVLRRRTLPDFMAGSGSVERLVVDGARVALVSPGLASGHLMTWKGEGSAEVLYLPLGMTKVLGLRGDALYLHDVSGRTLGAYDLAVPCLCLFPPLVAVGALSPGP